MDRDLHSGRCLTDMRALSDGLHSMAVSNHSQSLCRSASPATKAHLARRSGKTSTRLGLGAVHIVCGTLEPVQFSRNQRHALPLLHNLLEARLRKESRRVSLSAHHGTQPVAKARAYLVFCWDEGAKRLKQRRVTQQGGHIWRWW